MMIETFDPVRYDPTLALSKFANGKFAGNKLEWLTNEDLVFIKEQCLSPLLAAACVGELKARAGSRGRRR